MKKLLCCIPTFDCDSNTNYVIHPAERGEIELEFDAPWENHNIWLSNLLWLDGKYLLYYVSYKTFFTGMKDDGTSLEDTPSKSMRQKESCVFACVAYSTDGIHFTRPQLGLYKFNGDTKNNILFKLNESGGDVMDQVSFFLDTNPGCAHSERVKMAAMFIGSSDHIDYLRFFASQDGLSFHPVTPYPDDNRGEHWKNDGGTIIEGVFDTTESRFYDEDEGRFITKLRFDTDNNCFWDEKIGCYRLFARCLCREKPDLFGITDSKEYSQWAGHHIHRDICEMRSENLHTWTGPVPVKYTDDEHIELYRNGIVPYGGGYIALVMHYDEYRWGAVHGQFPDSLHRRRRIKAGNMLRLGTAASETVLMTSADGVTWNRYTDTPFIKNGIENGENWVYGDRITLPAVIETEDRLVFYSKENVGKSPEKIRRYTLRRDGFVSLHSGAEVGCAVTPCISVSGNRIILNMETTVSGYVLVELLNENGSPIEGFSADECDFLYGDTLSRTVSWNNGFSDISSVDGQKIRIKLTLRHAHIYSITVSE